MEIFIPTEAHAYIYLKIFRLAIWLIKVKWMNILICCMHICVHCKGIHVYTYINMHTSSIICISEKENYMINAMNGTGKLW